MLVLHDYSALLPATSRIQGYTGYLDEVAQKELEAAQIPYEWELRKFVYASLRRQSDTAWLKTQILAELADMEREQGPCMGEFSTLRHDLLTEIDKQARLGLAARYVRRLIPGVIAAIRAILKLVSYVT